MSESIYLLINAVISTLGGGWIFVITVGVELALFSVALILTLLKPAYSLKNRAWVFIFGGATLFLELAFLSLANQLELFYLTAFITASLSGVIGLLPQKQVKIKNQQRELARFIDQSVKEAEAEQFPQEEKPTAVYKSQTFDDVGRFELDFQHVKLVLQKLEYYPLSAGDKKIMRDLEESISLAENQGFSSLIKNKINDGLGALLKIMSKYGV